MIFSSLFSILALAAALPAPQSGVLCPSCGPSDSWACAIITSRTTSPGTPWQLAVSGPPNSTLSYGEGYTVGSSWTIGANLGLTPGDLINFGFTGSYSESVSSTINEGDSMECPTGDGTLGGTSFACGMVATPSMMNITGYSTAVAWISTEDNCPNGFKYPGSAGPYQLLAPRTDNSGNGVIALSLCTCQNILIADPNGVAPPLPCPTDCAVPAG